MSVAQETIEDIIREKRGIAAKIRANLSIVPVRREDQLLVADSLDQEADRLEAALKRENELSKLRPKNVANLGQFGNNPDTLGNVAAKREALDEILEKQVEYRWNYGALGVRKGSERGCGMNSDKVGQLIIADELINMAQFCLKRLHDSSYGTFGNQTKDQLAKVDGAMSELSRLVRNELEKIEGVKGKSE